MIITTEIIGTPIKIGNLEIAQNNFSQEMDCDTAFQSCLDLGDGWRLPNDKELDILYQNKDIICGFNDYYYWSSTEHNNDGSWDYDGEGAWIQIFKDGMQGACSKKDEYNVRAVKGYM
jgi:hypothetical protein